MILQDTFGWNLLKKNHIRLKYFNLCASTSERTRQWYKTYWKWSWKRVWEFYIRLVLLEWRNLPWILSFFHSSEIWSCWKKESNVARNGSCVMLHAKSLSSCFWVKALNTACLIHNHIFLHPGTLYTIYQFWKGHKLNVKYFNVFYSDLFHILNGREFKQKWDSKSDECIFLGYSTNSRVFLGV